MDELQKNIWDWSPLQFRSKIAQINCIRYFDTLVNNADVIILLYFSSFWEFGHCRKFAKPKRLKSTNRAKLVEIPEIQNMSILNLNSTFLYFLYRKVFFASFVTSKKFHFPIATIAFIFHSSTEWSLKIYFEAFQKKLVRFKNLCVTFKLNSCTLKKCKRWVNTIKKFKPINMF